jgi:four helix bundle suffix protein
MQTELRLVNVARASQEELLLDYEDYLRHRRLPQWAMDSPEASEVRAVPRTFKKDPSDPMDLTDLTDQRRWALYSRWLDHDDPAIRANATICLIHQVNYLLDRQIAALEEAFVDEGGYSEQLATERLRRRRRDQTDPRLFRQIQRIRSHRLVRNAAASWRCAPPRPEKTPAVNSGVAPATRNAKELPRSDRSVRSDSSD